MRKILLLALIIHSLSVNGQGFGPSVTNWSTAAGGYYSSNGTNYGYYKEYFWGPSNNNSQTWSLLDINGDALPDLVVPSEYQSVNNGTKQYGVGSSPYWKVYFNTGSGLSSVATNWPTPVGGYYSSNGVNYGYYKFDFIGPSDNNSQTWTLTDMNGDAKPDLVVMSEYQTANNGIKQYGAGTAPYWKVYLNTGSSFSTTANNWSTPIGGYYSNTGVNYGYYQSFFSGPSYNNSQTWSLADINGDAMPDLIVPSEYQTVNNGSKQYGVGSMPYWKVYLNNGSGFSNTFTNWPTPVGGYYSNTGVNYGYYNSYFSGASYNNSQNWSLVDINGDSKVDLVINSEYQSVNNGSKQYGAGSSPYWKVYLNSGAGFSTSATNWSTPIGGYYSSTGVNYGYFQFYFSGASDNNTQVWSFMDINGDDKPDLIVSSEYQTAANGTKQYGLPASPYWKVFLNTGTGISTTAINFTTPAGGYYNSTGVNYGYFNFNFSSPSDNNSQAWSVTDMNGDNKIDLLVSSEYQSVYNGPKQYGVGASPFWKVYLNSGLTSLGENQGEGTIGLYPNPFEDVVYFQTPFLGEIKVYSIEGKMMHKQSVSLTTNYIDLQFLPAGLYIIQKIEQDVIHSGRLVKY